MEFMSPSLGLSDLTVTNGIQQERCYMTVRLGQKRSDLIVDILFKNVDIKLSLVIQPLPWYLALDSIHMFKIIFK